MRRRIRTSTSWEETMAMRRKLTLVLTSWALQPLQQFRSTFSPKPTAPQPPVGTHFRSQGTVLMQNLKTRGTNPEALLPGKAQDALSKLANAAEAEKAAKLERERELAKVKISKEDVELIMADPDDATTEMELEEGKAERVLRENDGDPIAALRALVNK